MLIQTEVGRAEVVAKQLAGLAGVLSSEYVTGPYDVVVRIGADTLSDLQDTVVPSVQQVAGITRTLTCPIADGAAPLELPCGTHDRRQRRRPAAVPADRRGRGRRRGGRRGAGHRRASGSCPSSCSRSPSPSVPAPAGRQAAECTALLAALPDQLGDYRRAAAAEPGAGRAPRRGRATPDAEPVILRCGLDRPAEFVVGAPIQVVDAVQWFERRPTRTGAPGSPWTGRYI